MRNNNVELVGKTILVICAAGFYWFQFSICFTYFCTWGNKKALYNADEKVNDPLSVLCSNEEV